MSKRLTIASINAAIKAKGGNEILYKGNGYFYFWEGDAPDWHSSSVMVYRLNDLTLEQWVNEWERMRDEHNTKR